jgi:hypothetical protein
MSRALLIQIRTAHAQGADLKQVLSDILHRKCSEDGRLGLIAFTAWFAATLVFVTAVLAVILQDVVREIPVIEAFARMEDSHLQTIAAVCAIIASMLFMLYLKLRQEQTKHTFLLVMVLDGGVREAAALLFGGTSASGREGKSDFVLDATGAVLDNL